MDHSRITHHRRRVRGPGATLFVGSIALLLGAGTLFAPSAHADLGFEVQSLDGGGNNRAHPEWGRVGTNYARVAPARYADGLSAPMPGPNGRRGQQPRLQRREPEPVLGTQRHPVGLRLGTVPGPHVRAAPRARRRRHPGSELPQHRLRPERSDGGVRQRHRIHPVHPVERGRRHRCHQCSPAGEHRQLVHRRLGRVRRHAGPSGMDARGSGRRQPGQQRRRGCCCRTASCRGGTSGARPRRRR